MILQAVKLVSGLNTKLIKFKVVPRQTKHNLFVENNKPSEVDVPNLLAFRTQPSALNKSHTPHSGDDFTNAVTELLGAKQIE